MKVKEAMGKPRSLRRDRGGHQTVARAAFLVIHAKQLALCPDPETGVVNFSAV